MYYSIFLFKIDRKIEFSRRKVKKGKKKSKFKNRRERQEGQENNDVAAGIGSGSGRTGAKKNNYAQKRRKKEDRSCMEKAL